MTEDMLAKDKRDVKRNLRVEVQTQGTCVYAVAKHKKDQGQLLRIPAFRGTPLGNKCYDRVKDLYYVEAEDFVCIGEIPVSYKLIDPTNGWESMIPLPRAVLKRYMTDYQRTTFSKWKSNFPDSLYKIEFLQVLRSG